MTSDDLRKILAEAKGLLEDNKRLVTPEVIKLVEGIIPLFKQFQATGEVPVSRASFGENFDANGAGKISAALEAFVDHERRLVETDLTEKVTNGLDSLANHPLLLRGVAALL